jgi:hypothetical protein
MISVTKEPSDTHKKKPKEEILEEITVKLMAKILHTWLTTMYKMHSRNFKRAKIKNMRRHSNK